MPDKPYADCTGRLAQLLPSGPECDELLGLVRIGIKFRLQQRGKRPGALAQLVLDSAKRAGPPYSFAQLLEELELEAARRELRGQQASPVEKVDRVWSLATVHLPKRGRVQVPFGTLRNHLTEARKALLAQIPALP